MLVNLNVNVPRYFIQWKLGTRELGIYSALAFLMSAGNLFVGALAQAVFVRLARFYARGSAARLRLSPPEATRHWHGARSGRNSRGLDRRSPVS